MELPETAERRKHRQLSASVEYDRDSRAPRNSVRHWDG